MEYRVKLFTGDSFKTLLEGNKKALHCVDKYLQPYQTGRDYSQA